MADEASFAYDKDKNIFFINVFARQTFATAASAVDAFAIIRKYWREKIGVKCYAVIDYTDTKIEKAAVDAFSVERQRINAELGLTTVRFTADPMTRAIMRTMSVKIHQPSNIYTSKQEAIDVVLGLQSGSIVAA